MIFGKYIVKFGYKPERLYHCSPPKNFELLDYFKNFIKLSSKNLKPLQQTIKPNFNVD